MGNRDSRQSYQTESSFLPPSLSLFSALYPCSLSLPSVSFLCLCLFSLSLPSVVPAQESKPTSDLTTNGNESTDPMGVGAENGAQPKLIAMNFQDVEISALAKFISEITGKNFIIDEKVRGKVTVISPTKITPEAAYLMFQSVLQVKGFTTVSSGAIIKVVPTREAKQTGLPTLSPGSIIPRGDEFVTRLVPLRHVEAVEMATVLRPMVSSDGLVVPYIPTNNLILTDAASNLQRLLGMIEELDVEWDQQTTEVIPLKHAFAEDLAKKIEEFLQGQRNQRQTVAGTKPGRPAASPATISSPTRPLRVLPDERTNSLIVAAGPIELRAAKKLISQLDIPLAPGTSRVNVYYLKNANAEEMLPVLGDLIGARTSSRQQDGVRQGHSGRSRSPYNRQGQMGRSVATSSASSAPSQVVGSASEFVSEVRVTADPATNALLISASPQDFETLKKVIDMLDVRRRQVYVEALILEVSVNRFRQLGIEFQADVNFNSKGVGLARVNLRDLNAVLTNPASLSGLILAAASNRTVTLPDGTEVPAEAALLRAAQLSADINVLSAPTILTTDNQEAEILVGENVPFIASRATDSSDLDNLFSTVERHDVGIRLRLIPQISEGNLVRLDVYEEVSDVIPSSPAVGDPDLVGPTISIRSASTTIVVKNGRTVVIGGLISDDSIRSESKVPFLGDIPVLGNFFKFKDDQTRKINLLIFLTPHIIRDESEMAALASGERDRFKQFLQEYDAPPRWQEQLERPSFAAPPK